MSAQQLDLFGNPIAPQPAIKKKVESLELVQPIVVEIQQPIEELQQQIVIPETLAPKKIIESITQLDEKPKVKSNRGRKPKPKIPQELQPAKAKRGRKSYAEAFDHVDLVNVPSNEELQQKLYYSISEVSGWFNITTSQLRFWERQFSVLKPRKNRKGDRLFRQEDIQNIKIIHYLLRHRKFSIEGAKDYFKSNKHKTEFGLQLQESLTSLKSFLLEIKANL